MGNKWRSSRKLRGVLHYKTFNTRTEAALFFDLLGSDGHNFPEEFEDAEQMAETLRDVRSYQWLRSCTRHREYADRSGFNGLFTTS